MLEAGAAVLGVAFLMKAGMWPLCFWLPSAYAAAAAPVAATFAIMSKVGVYVLLRLSLLFFGERAGPSAGFGSEVLLVRRHGDDCLRRDRRACLAEAWPHCGLLGAGFLWNSARLDKPVADRSHRRRAVLSGQLHAHHRRVLSADRTRRAGPGRRRERVRRRCGSL